MSPTIQTVVETSPCREWVQGGVGDAGWHQVPELLKEGLSKPGSVLPFLTMRLVLGKDEGWICNGHSGETPRQYVTIAAVHGKHSFRDWCEAAINDK